MTLVIILLPKVIYCIFIDTESADSQPHDRDPSETQLGSQQRCERLGTPMLPREHTAYDEEESGSRECRALVHHLFTEPSHVHCVP